jgi:uncharacterized 2Fe-2S/4Fe-4S cluster protein (DUF4445 family)
LDYKISFEPLGIRINCPRGATIFEAARDAGVTLTSICGGRGICGQCRVQILDGKTSSTARKKKSYCNEQELDEGFYLACETIPLGDLRVYLPLTSLSVEQRLQINGPDVASVIDPVLAHYELDLRDYMPEKSYLDWDNLCSILKTQSIRCARADLSVLQRFSSILHSPVSTIGITVRGDEVIDIHQAGQEILGVAIDLGTMKIAAHLVDLNSWKLLAARGVTNPQVAFGEDVMSRITYALENGGNKLRSSVTTAINQLIEELTGDVEKVAELTLVANTAMHHLLLGLPVSHLGRAPYAPVIRSSLDIKARDLGLHIAPGAYAHFLPGIAGFVGGDHVAMLMATGIHDTDKTVLGIDIGTNTEISLARKRMMSCVSCASGPAFEGAHIENGMKAASGAIESVKIGRNRIELTVIDNVPPIGICGSGILDTVAQLRRHRIIDKRGRFQDHEMVCQGDNGCEFILAGACDSNTRKNICITGGDIAEIQLAKAAIRTGIDTLLYESNTNEEDIDEVVIAGAFGSYIDVSSAIAIGMLPSISLDKFKQVGNAAGVGARLALASKRHRSMAQKIAEKVRHIDLGNYSEFSSRYLKAMWFP